MWYKRGDGISNRQWGGGLRRISLQWNFDSLYSVPLRLSCISVFILPEIGVGIYGGGMVVGGGITFIC